jgi:hypothetical protein
LSAGTKELPPLDFALTWASVGAVPTTHRDKKDRVMGEFNKDPNQGGIGKEQQGDKSAFDQFEKGQPGQQDQKDFGQEKGQDPGQGKEQFGQEKQAGQQFAQEKEQFGQDKSQSGQDNQEQPGIDKGGQQQFENKGQRQQGDEDLDEDSKSNIDNQGLK